jgi:hypothetical protein
MNPPKSKYSPGLAAKIVNLKIESDENGIKIDAEGTDGDGNPTHSQYDAKFDGKDNAVTAKAVLDQQRADYTETEVAHVKLAHRPGEMDRAAPRLGDAGININHSYCGTEAVTNASILIFGGRCRCDSWVFLREVCIDYAGDVLSEALLDGEDLG